jgi:sugar O-acyltransferase (sialic acid O-acetyltransferase NeuD family)
MAIDAVPLAIYGAGGLAREVLGLVDDLNAESRQYDVIGFLDDDPARWGETLNGVPVVGGIDWLKRQHRAPAIVIGVGAPRAKRRLAEALRAHARSFPVLIHPTVVRSTHISYGDGVVIAAGNILTCNIEVGDFALINLACTVGHDAKIGAHATIAPGVHVSGNVAIEDGCDVGTGAAIIQGVRVGGWSVVGAGAVVTKDLPMNCTAVGVPARPIKQHPASEPASTSPSLSTGAAE